MRSHLTQRGGTEDPKAGAGFRSSLGLRSVKAVAHACPKLTKSLNEVFNDCLTTQLTIILRKTRNNYSKILGFGQASHEVGAGEPCAAAGTRPKPPLPTILLRLTWCKRCLVVYY